MLVDVSLGFSVINYLAFGNVKSEEFNFRTINVSEIVFFFAAMLYVPAL